MPIAEPVESTYFPSKRNRALDTLVENARRKREALFAGSALHLRESHPEVMASSELGECFNDFQRSSGVERDALTSHPVFALALDRFLRSDIDSGTTAPTEATGLAASYRRAREAISATDVLRIDRTELRRWDTDPLIMELAPPTYAFPPPAERERRERDDAYSLDAFRVIATTALDRIGIAWPELRLHFDLLVPVIVQIPDAPYRSASAARYRGVVFLSSDDATLLELEESLVHEFGHQILYHVMADRPLLAAGESKTYVLPWSGSKRDFYGYVHAFYIYLLLALYLERASGDTAHEADEVRPLLEHIVGGLCEARHDFVPDERFTSAGRQFIESLQTEIDRLNDRLGRQSEVVG